MSYRRGGNVYTVSFEKRELLIKHDLCSNCGICMAFKTLDFCPQVNIADYLYERDPLPPPRLAVMARCRDSTILEQAQDGGVVTALLYVALKRGLARYALGCRFGRGEVIAVPEVVQKPEDVVKLSKSKYVYVPTLALLNRVKLEEGVCVVGVPCQIRALKLLEERRGIKLLKIGLLCSSNFKKELVLDILKKYGKTVDDIARMEIKKKFRIIFRDGAVVEVDLREAKKYSANCCRQCPELVPLYADVAVGSMFLPEKWNFVLVYTEEGEKLFRTAVEEGLLETQELPQEVLAKVRELAAKKQSDGKKVRQEFLQVIRQVLEV